MFRNWFYCVIAFFTVWISNVTKPRYKISNSSLKYATAYSFEKENILPNVHLNRCCQKFCEGSSVTSVKLQLISFAISVMYGENMLYSH